MVKASPANEGKYRLIHSALCLGCLCGRYTCRVHDLMLTWYVTCYVGCAMYARVGEQDVDVVAVLDPLPLLSCLRVLLSCCC